MSTPTAKAKGKQFGSSGRGHNRPLPAMLARQDVEHGKWKVEHCRPVRGEPATSVSEKIMLVPTTDSDLARVIRAHEMIHAKISPTAEQFEQWIGREVASETAMIAVEELRVNYLAQKAGFDVKNHLSDGSELNAGERMAQTNDWAGAVAMCIATAGTAGHKQFLNGIRRHDRAWGDALLDIGKRAVKEIRKADKHGHLGSSKVPDSHSGLPAPYGFANTERLAEWLDRLADFAPPERRKEKGKGKGKDDDKAEGVDKSHGNKGENDEARRDGERHKGITPSESSGGTWGELRIERCPMPKISKGIMGKKRIATNMGRRPRRIHRMLTDPAMRVFDRTTKGTGGMVIIDASGSMSFTTQQIHEIITHAPGATVAIYSDRNNKNTTNFWIVADKGRMVENVDNCDYGYGNGVDFPAIQWGVKNRRNPKAPLVWVTDGGVCGLNDGYSDKLAIQCLTYARKNKFIVVPHVGEAIRQLKQMSNGGTAKSVYPMMFVELWKELMGETLNGESVYGE
jgi:hypothetical protein